MQYEGKNSHDITTPWFRGIFGLKYNRGGAHCDSEGTIEDIVNFPVLPLMSDHLGSMANALIYKPYLLWYQRRDALHRKINRNPLSKILGNLKILKGDLKTLRLYHWSSPLPSHEFCREFCKPLCHLNCGIGKCELCDKTVIQTQLAQVIWAVLLPHPLEIFCNYLWGHFGGLLIEILRKNWFFGIVGIFYIKWMKLMGFFSVKIQERRIFQIFQFRANMPTRAKCYLLR